MEIKYCKYILHFIAAISIAYATTIAVAHHHDTHHHNCPVCHFQHDNTSDIHTAIIANDNNFIELPYCENHQYVYLLIHFVNSRSPPKIS